MSLYNAHFNSFKMYKNKSIINPIGTIIFLEKNVSFKWKGIKAFIYWAQRYDGKEVEKSEDSKGNTE